MKRMLIVGVLLALVVGGYVYFSNEAQQEQSGEITLYGNVDIRDVVLAFRVPGRLQTLVFEEGDTVEAGEVVATLDREPFEEELALREAELNEALAVQINAEKIYLRRAALAKTGAVSQTVYDQALAARDEAAARVATSRARIDVAQTQLADTELRAPNSGTLLTRVREPGAVVAEGAPVYTLALARPVWVRTYIDEPSLGHVFPGQRATVLTDSGGRYIGQVGFISPQAEFTPRNVETTQLRTDLVYRLRVIVDTPDHGLRQGMPVTVKLEKGAAQRR